MLDELAVADALGAATQGGVVIVDDWGLADANSRAALSALAARGTGVAVVGAALPDDRVPEGATRLTLDPLGEAELHALCARALGVESLPAGVVSYVRAHAGGNPAMARLIVEALVDAKMVTLHAGRATASTNVSAVSAPASLLLAWQARFDRMTDETRALLRAAAVVGHEFELDVAAAMIGVDGQLRGPALLQPAQQAGLVEHAHGATYVFSHGALRDAIRDRILSVDLVQMHRRALEILESRAAPDDVAGLQALANHAEAAKDDARFVHFGGLAARAGPTARLMGPKRLGGVTGGSTGAGTA
jgi:adenylate cyclase